MSGVPYCSLSFTCQVLSVLKLILSMKNGQYLAQRVAVMVLEKDSSRVMAVLGFIVFRQSLVVFRQSLIVSR